MDELINQHFDDENVESPPLLLPRFAVSQSHLSRKRRRQAMTTRGVTHINALAYFLEALEEYDELDPETLQLILEEMEGVVFVDVSDGANVRKKRNSGQPVLQSIDAMLAAGVNSTLFYLLVGFTPYEVKLLTIYLFNNAQQVEFGRLAPIDTEEALMIVLLRLKGILRTFDSMQILIRRDSSLIGKYFRESARYLLREFRHLLALENLGRFTPRVNPYEEAILTKFQQGHLEEMPNRFQGSSGFLDGSRVEVGASREAQPSIFNGHKSISNLNYLLITAPDGIVMALSEPAAGRHADSWLQSEHDVNYYLQRAGIVVCTDSGFAFDTNVRPIPKSNQIARQMMTDKQIERIRSCRVAVEWAIQEVKSTFPLIVDTSKMKVFATYPDNLVRLSVLFANFRTCLNGSKATKYFGVLPPTLEEYLDVLN